MSLAVLVILAAKSAPSAESWQRAMNAQHVPVQFTQSLDLTKHSGFVPLQLGERQSGFFFLRERFSELMQHYPALTATKLTQPTVYSLGYGGDPWECASAFYAASVLVSQFGGSAFEPEGGVFMTAQQLLDAAGQCEALGDLG